MGGNDKTIHEKAQSYTPLELLELLDARLPVVMLRRPDANFLIEQAFCAYRLCRTCITSDTSALNEEAATSLKKLVAKDEGVYRFGRCAGGGKG